MSHQGRLLSCTTEIFSSSNNLAGQRNPKQSGVSSPASMGVWGTPPPPLPLIVHIPRPVALGMYYLTHIHNLGRWRRLEVARRWKAQSLCDSPELG